MSTTQAFFIGLMTGWIPSMIVLAIVLWCSPRVELREDAETPRDRPYTRRRPISPSPSDLRPRSLKQVRATAPAASPTGAASKPFRQELTR